MNERRPVRPDNEHVWANGQWRWDDGRWGWSQGRWQRHEVRNVYWIAPRYVRSGRGYLYEPGHWSNQTVIIGDDLRARPEWRRHEREHERELERERERERRYNRDRS